MDQYDRLQPNLIQFVDILNFLGETPENYSLLLPENALALLTDYYKLSPAYSFFIVRSGFKPLYSISSEEFDDLTLKSQYVLETHLRNQEIGENNYFDVTKFFEEKI